MTQEGSPRIGLVGHCGFDGRSLEHAIRRAAPGAAIVTINGAQELRHELERCDLLLVNRVLDGRFETDSGVELIGSIVDRGNPVSTILVSNYPDAQQAAQKLGALPGFGKSDLGPGSMAEERIRAALGVGGAST